MTDVSTIRRLLAAAGLAALLAGCLGATVMPTAAPILAPVASGDEAEHTQLVSSFGGVYSAPSSQALVEAITARLVRATERPEERYRVTLLDTPAVNAFALPSGRLYVTRGLLALANDTSELAAVMAHEIAHVTLRHATARTEREARSALVSRVVSDVLRDQRASATIRETSRYDLARFSREQELEADAISVRTLAGAGFDPFGAARFLTALDRHVALQSGLPDSGDDRGANRLATHPSTPERIAEARNAARRIGAPGLATDDRARYLAAIDGIAFGDDPRDGIVRGPRYVNARLAIGFTAPDGFTLDNSSRAVLGASPDGERRLMFDAVEAGAGQSLADVLRATWTDAVQTGDIEERQINGLPAALATAQGETWRFRVASLRAGTATYRLIFAFRGGDSGAEAAFQRTLGSIRRISDAEIAGMARPRLRIVTASAGDTLETLSTRMLTDKPLETFRTLNGLFDNTRIMAGGRYKIVAP